MVFSITKGEEISSSLSCRGEVGGGGGDGFWGGLGMVLVSQSYGARVNAS